MHLTSSRKPKNSWKQQRKQRTRATLRRLQSYTCRSRRSRSMIEDQFLTSIDEPQQFTVSPASQHHDQKSKDTLGKKARKQHYEDWSYVHILHEKLLSHTNTVLRTKARRSLSTTIFLQALQRIRKFRWSLYLLVWMGIGLSWRSGLKAGMNVMWLLL